MLANTYVHKLLPEAPHHMLSCGSALEHGIGFQGKIGRRKVALVNNGKAVGVATREASLNTLEAHVAAPSLGADVHVGFQMLARKCMRGPRHGDVLRIVRHASGAVTGTGVTEKQLRAGIGQLCETCIKAKHAASPHPVPNTRKKRPLEAVPPDLVATIGPICMRPASAG